jgi:peptide/nickel transport system permease protein
MDVARTQPLPRRLFRLQASVNGFVLAGGAILTVIVLAALAAPVLANWGETEIDGAAVLVPPGTEGHLLGTDRNGMDIWSRILYGARLDLGIALTAVAIAVLVGGTLGSIVGYAGSWLDEITMRAMDTFQAFPAFVLALVVAAVLGPGVVNLIAVIALVNTPGYVRLMRAEVRSVREHGFVEAARCSGASWPDIVFRHIVPNSLRPVLVIAPLNCGWAILMLAGLSFLGLGVTIPTAEWGAMIAIGAADMVRGDWWTSVFPGLALFLSVLGFNLVSEGLLEAGNRRR